MVAGTHVAFRLEEPMNTSPARHPLLLASATLGLLGPGLWLSFEARAQGNPAPGLAGSWRLLVTRDPGVPSVTYFLTAFSDGTAIASQFSPGPDANHNDAHSHVFHGVWVRDGNAANFTVSGQETDENRAFHTLKFRGHVTFGPDGNTLSGQWAGSATTEDGRLLGSAMRSVTGTRLRVEPLASAPLPTPVQEVFLCSAPSVSRSQPC